MDLNRYTITGHGLTATFTEWGASLVDLRLDRHDAPLVLGLADLSDYAAGHASYMGATAGRCANRIGHATYTLDGETHHLDANFEGKHMLHGGSKGMGKQVWTVTDHGDDAITLTLDLPDGHMGFPGRLSTEARFSCGPDATLRVEYRATTDKPTLCNLAHHSYFCLDDSGDIAGHRLWVDADRYVTVDAGLIPTGAASVEGTSFDFRDGRALPGESLLDHNLCLSDARVSLREVGRLMSERSGVTMRIATTEAGIQVYDGAKLATPVDGIGGRRYGPNAGIALEPQVWPDAPNHPDFPSAVLRPGETYEQISTFSFAKG